MTRPLALLPFDVPVDPDAEEARRWLLDELVKPPYQAAQPTWFDLLSSAVWDWLTSLSFGGGALDWGLVLVMLLIVAGVAVAAFFIFGRPRLNQRSAVTGSLFGVDETRSADELRRAAVRAAAAGDWTLAIQERFRALARALAERTIVTTSPGTTARGFAAHAATAFEEHAARLLEAAAAFDEVRYLGHDGTESAYRDVAALDDELASTRPAHPAAGMRHPEFTGGAQ